MRVKISQTKDHKKKKIAIVFIIVFLLGVVSVWAIQLKSTIAMNIDRLSQKSLDDNSSEERERMKKDFEDVLPVLNENLDTMIADIKNTVANEQVDPAIKNEINKEIIKSINEKTTQNIENNPESSIQDQMLISE